MSADLRKAAQVLYILNQLCLHLTIVVQWSAHPIRYVLFILSLCLNSLSLLRLGRSQVRILSMVSMLSLLPSINRKCTLYTALCF